VGNQNLQLRLSPFATNLEAGTKTNKHYLLTSNLLYLPFLYLYYFGVSVSQTVRQRSGATRGLGLKMRGFSVKHKYSKYKTIFKFSLMPKSRVTPVSRSVFYLSLIKVNSAVVKI